MINKITFAKRIVLTVSMAFVITFGIVYFVVIDNYKKSILTEEHDKIEFLLNTISPLVAINMDFGLMNNIKDTFNNTVKIHTQIVKIELLNLDNKSLVKIGNINSNDKIMRTQKILQDASGNDLGSIVIFYSNQHYIVSVENFQNMLIYIFIFILFFLIIFSKYLVYLFKPLSIISFELSKYDLENHRQLGLNYKTTTDEFSIINNTIVSMMNKIEAHTATLETTVEIEVSKNIKREILLFEQAKMAQMGEMIGNIAHQWRQPLSLISIVASGTLMSSQYDQLDEKTLSNNMNLIMKHTTYLSDTIEIFKNFIKDKKELKELVVQECIGQALSIVDGTLKDNDIEVKKSYVDLDPILLNLISGELSQVIINIMNNAKDILIENEIEDRWIELCIEETSEEVIITIEDNAGGVPENIITKIFNPYFTTKHESQGTGLGLHMSYRIITESLKGLLSVINTKNGAKFNIKLPKQS